MPAANGTTPLKGARKREAKTPATPHSWNNVRASPTSCGLRLKGRTRPGERRTERPSQKEQAWPAIAPATAPMRMLPSGTGAAAATMPIANSIVLPGKTKLTRTNDSQNAMAKAAATDAAG